MTPRLLWKTGLSLVVLAFLAGCSTPTHYVVVPETEENAPSPRQQPAPLAVPERYTVKSGDSLYLISFATGTDWRELARLNAITPPYRIFPGQSLLVRPGRSVTTRPAEPQPAAAPLQQPAPTHTSPIPLPVPASPSGVAQIPPSVPGPSRPVAAAPAPAPSAPKAAAAAARPTAVTPVRSASLAPPSLKPPRTGAWQWPASGRVIGRFAGGAQPHKGIDLDGRSGDPVRAANSGVVVYAGSGVRGYGNLLIVKHDDVFLSAYAHNSELLVKEGDVVKAGQTIARIGDSGTDRVKLHFEVRRKGTPVDPAKILPRR